MGKRDVLIRTALLALVAVCLAAFLRESGQAIPVIGQPLPNFSLDTDGGRPLRLADLRGKIVVLNFWATWCPPCVEEMPSLDRFARTYASRGVEVVAISVDDDAKAYRDFLQAHSLKLRTVLDPGKKVSEQYGTFKYPETYIADRQGRLVRKIVGPADWMDPRVTEIVDQLLRN